MGTFTVKTWMKCRTMQHFIRVYTVKVKKKLILMIKISIEKLILYFKGVIGRNFKITMHYCHENTFLSLQTVPP